MKRVVRVRAHWRVGVFIRAHFKLLSVLGKSELKKKLDAIKNDPDVSGFEPPINVREVSRAGYRGRAAGIYFPPAAHIKPGPRQRGFVILIDKASPFPEYTFFHELGHIKDRVLTGTSSEKSADAFANRKIRELRLLPSELVIPELPRHKLKISKYERRGQRDLEGDLPEGEFYDRRAIEGF